MQPLDFMGHNRLTNTLHIDPDTVYLAIKAGPKGRLLTSGVYIGDNVPVDNIGVTIAIGAISLWNMEPQMMYDAAMEDYGIKEGLEDGDTAYPDYRTNSAS